MFGLKEAEVAIAIRAVTRDDLDREEIEERFARATWTGVAEPGDAVAGILISAFGAAGALAAVVEKRGAPAILADLGDEAGLTASDVQKAIERWTPRLDSAGSLLALRQAARCGTRLSIPIDDEWPDGVDELGAHRPTALWIRGTREAVLALPRSLALVGARAATGYGEHVAMESSAGLVDRGYAIVSGAAYGIDGMAHRAALASHGATIAFLAGGVDRFYPTGHDALLSRIVEQGAVISELPCGSSPTKWRFLQQKHESYA